MTYAMDAMVKKLRESTSLRPSLPASTSTDRTDDSERSVMTEIQDAVRAHNKARTPRGCPLVQWDAELAAMATEYAKVLAISNKLEPSGVQGQGENLLASAAESYYVDAVDVWLAEMNKYDGEKIAEGNLSEFGRFSRP